MAERSAKRILDEAADLLRTAQFGLEDMKLRPGRAKTGLRNAIVFGRMVTFALQNLRSMSPEFDEWYAPKVEAMRADALMRYLYELRTVIEKTANTPVQTSTFIKSYGPEEREKLQPAPPGATGFFIGDSSGGSGWVVETEHGDEIYYIDLPAEIGEVHLRLEGAPDEYAGRPATELLDLYLKWLSGLIAEARAKFGN